MADKKITELNQLSQAQVAAGDVAPIADISANETRKVTVPDLVQAGTRLMPDGSIPGAKLEDGAVDTEQLANDAVTEDKIEDGAVTEDKLANNAVTENKIANDAVTADKIADDAVTLDKLDSSNYGRGIDKGASDIGITNSITAGTFAGITYNEQGLITGVDASGDVPRDDLPIATTTEVGVVAVPTAGGLTVSGTGDLSINNTVTADTKAKITYNEQGLVTAGADLVASDLPIATATTVGAVSVPATDADGDTPLDIDGNGAVTHDDSGITAGTYEKVTVDKYGHVTAGTDLVAGDIPDIGADKITSGTLPVADNVPDVGISAQGYVTAVPEDSISRRHFSNTSIAYIQEAQPPSDATAGTDRTVFRGCLWFKESTGQLYMHNGNAWHIVAGGQLTQENLRFMGTYNADTNVIVTLTDEGVAEQLDGSAAFTVNSAVPNCDDDLSGCYFLVTTAGSSINVNDVSGDSFDVGDLLLGISTATGWVQVSGSFSGGGGGSGFWERTGAPPTAELTPTNAADNLDLQGGDWLALPHGNGSANAPSSGHAGTVRWDITDGEIEIWDGTAWRRAAEKRQFQWETIEAADNGDWAQDVLRPINTDADIAVRPNRSLVFENGTATDGTVPTSGDATCQLRLNTNVNTTRTYELPNGDNGTTAELATQVILTDASTIDCGTYPDN